MNKDCIVYDIKKDTEVHWLDGYLIKVPKSKDFNYEYILFIPKNINENTTLIIEGSNCTISVSDLESAKDIILKEGLYPSLPIYDVANELGLPVLFPLFPRIYNGEETIYNHMLSSNSLDNSTLKIKELGLERVDLQLINMFKDVESPKCYFCEHGKRIPNTSDVICSKKGIVSEEYVCKKYSYDIFKREVKRKANLNTSKFSKEDFEL